MALPPMVKDAVSPVTTRGVSTPLVPSWLMSCTEMVAPVAPEMTPQISPTASLHSDATFSAFFSSQIASFAPGTRREAME